MTNILEIRSPEICPLSLHKHCTPPVGSVEPRSNLLPRPAVITEDFLGFPQFLQSDPGILPCNDGTTQTPSFHILWK